jgi:hypothetical protein
VPRLPLRILRDAMERRRKAHMRSPRHVAFRRHGLRRQVFHNANASQYRLCCRAFSAAKRAAYSAEVNFGFAVTLRIRTFVCLFYDAMTFSRRGFTSLSRKYLFRHPEVRAKLASKDDAGTSP